MKKKNESRFSEEVIPKRGRYAGKVILVSPRQRKRLLFQGRVDLPNATQKGKGKIKPTESKVKEAPVETKEEKITGKGK